MKEALKFLFAYSHYSDSLQEESKRLLDAVITTLAKMTEKDVQRYQ